MWDNLYENFEFTKKQTFDCIFNEQNMMHFHNINIKLIQETF